MTGKQKPDAAVNRLVRKWWKDLPAAYDHGGSIDKRIKRAWLAEIIIEARQSTARECAEIALSECALDYKGEVLAGTRDHGTAPEILRQIRARFGLEGK